jgi:YD repeat-containing protein
VRSDPTYESAPNTPILSKIIHDATGQPQFVWTYTYDNHERCIAKTVWGNLSGICPLTLALDAEEMPIDNGIEHYTVSYSYDDLDRLLSQEEDDGSFIHYSYDSQNRIPIEMVTGNGEEITWRQGIDGTDEIISIPPPAETTAELSPDGMESPELSSSQQLYSYFQSSKALFDRCMVACFGYPYLRLAGYYTEEFQCSSYGDQEIHPYIRTTLINGIGNLHNDVLNNVKSLYDSHGGTKIHYIFRPTLGWTRDLVHCAHIKIAGNMGYVSPYAHHLADLWRSLIQEMGEQGKIYHYAHSIGGADTYSALLLLTPEERTYLNVITIGSPTLIPDLGLNHIVNYVSSYDFVGPIGYMGALLNSNINVVYLDGHGIPLCDHALYQTTYNALMLSLGTQFLSYIKNLDTTCNF